MHDMHRPRGNLYPAEWIALCASAAMYLIGLPMAVLGEQNVAWNEFILWNAFAAALIAGGVERRVGGAAAGPANAMIAVGLLFTFGAGAALLNYMMFPLERTMIDPLLFRIDQRLGYFWGDFIHFFDSVPPLGVALSYLYNSALLQVLAVMVLLGLGGRVLYLHRFLVAGTVSVCLTLLIWAVAPSIGPSAYHPIPDPVAENINLVVDSAYGAELARLAAEGVPTIRASEIAGVIAFPSLHTVMACKVMAFTYGTRLFAPAVALNLPMIPATLAHGGHHLSDVLGGVTVFAVALAAAVWLLPGRRGTAA